MENIEKILLEKIGLTKSESLVYITLLKIGTSKAGKIIKISGINSGRIYETFESLKEKGLISESIINKTKHFTASPSFKLLEYLKIKKEKLEADEKTIKSNLIEINKLRDINTEGLKAFTYTGFNGIKTAIYEAFNSVKRNEELLGMGITGNKDKKFNELWLNFGKERIKKKIKAKNLFSDRTDFFKEYKRIKFTENRVLELFTPTTIDIFGNDKVLVLNYKEPCSCTLIYDKNTATSFREFFYQLWKLAKK